MSPGALAVALVSGRAEQFGRDLGARLPLKLVAQKRGRILATVGAQVGRHQRVAQRVVAGAVSGHSALQPLECVVGPSGDVELMGDAHVARGRLEIERELANQALDVAERARQGLAHGPQGQARMRERDGRVQRHGIELARQDGVERGQAAVAEHVAVALRSILHPVALGALGELDQPGCKRLGLGRHGTARRQVQRPDILTQGFHVGIAGAELAERLVDAENRVLGQRDAAGVACGHELVQQDERLLDARGEPRGAAPGGLARGLANGGQSLADGHDIDRADGRGHLHVEAVGRDGSPGRVCHERSASEVARREDRKGVQSSDFRASIDPTVACNDRPRGRGTDPLGPRSDSESA